MVRSKVAARVGAGLGSALALAVCAAGSGQVTWRADVRAAASIVRGAESLDTAARPARPPRLRFIFASETAATKVAANGWNLVDVGSKWDADRVPAGARGLVWVGDYDNEKCAWEISDAALKAKVGAMAGDAKVAGFFFSDEADPFACPAAPAEHRARSALLHRLAPGTFTVMVSDSNRGQQSLDQIPRWAGAADYIGLNPYPCYRGKPCNYGWIQTIIRAANQAHLRYWGVVQAFADSEWRWPTPAEEQHMLSQWARSRQKGYMTFAWTWAGKTLTGRPRLLAVLRGFNRGAPQRRRRTFEDERRTPTADEIHYTFAGPTSVAFDWRGTANTMRYGRTAKYGKVARAAARLPAPFSSSGPFREARLRRLKPGTTYHYSIGGGPDQTFSTVPIGAFRFDVEGDVGDSMNSSRVRATQEQIAADKPAFVIVAGDLTYGNANGQAAVDRHFNDVMAWSRRAAYMPAWGNHEWDDGDDLRNYKGRFAIPHGQASPGAPEQGCCGEDWGWFDAGGVRFISYPEPYTRATWVDWQSKASRLMASAQANPRIHFIVTFGHRPAYSSGYHSGDAALASILDGFGDRFSKYVLNLNAHSHNYERFMPIHHVVHVTAAGGGAALEPWRSKDARTAYRSLHLEHVRVDVTSTSMLIQALCGPASSSDGSSCRAGDVIDSYTIRR
jgi:hypothetical protein